MNVIGDNEQETVVGQNELRELRKEISEFELEMISLDQVAGREMLIIGYALRAISEMDLRRVRDYLLKGSVDSEMVKDPEIRTLYRAKADVINSALDMLPTFTENLDSMMALATKLVKKYAA